MKNIKKALIGIISAAAVMVTGCAGGTGGTASESAAPVKLSVLQLATHTALDASYKGFIDGLAEAGYAEGQNLTVEYQNAGGDKGVCQTVAAKFANNGSDLVFAIATDAAQAVANQVTDIPVFFTAVTDPVESGIVANADKPGANVTGTTDMAPIAAQADLIKKLAPEAKKVGIMFAAGETNSRVQAELAKKALTELGIESVEYTVSQTSEIQTVAEAAAKQVDAIYLPTDNMMASNMQTVSMIFSDAKLPVICGEMEMVNNGGLATYGLDYYNLGKQTAAMAVRVLKNGEKAGDLAVEGQKDFKFGYNKEIADTIGITIPADLLASSDDADTTATDGGTDTTAANGGADTTATDGNADTTAADSGADTTAAA